MKVEINIKIDIIEIKKNTVKFKIVEQSEFTRDNGCIFRNNDIKITSMGEPEVREYPDFISFFLRGFGTYKDNKVMEVSKYTFKIIKEALNNFKIIY